MTKANECTCPSVDGSLRHPCPAHPAVEQAGGDERDVQGAQGERECGHAACKSLGEHHPFCKFVSDQARAALAQPSPVRSSLLINGYQLRAALEFIAPDGTANQLESEARIEWRQQDADFLEAGLYAWCAEYPEEGCVLLDEEPATAQPSPAQAEQAEAERPEVVARVVHSNPVVLGQCGPLNANDELMTVAQHAASVARWAEMFNRVEQERDAALARVTSLESKLAELERQEPSGWLAYYFGGKRNGRIYGGPCNTKEEIDRYIQQVERSDDSITLQGKPFYAAPVAQPEETPGEILAAKLIETWVAKHGKPAPWSKIVEITALATNMPNDERDRLLALDDDVDAQAQHSVPDGYRLIRLEHFAAIKAQLNPEQVDAYRGRNIYDEDKVYANWNACRSALDEIKDVFQQIDWDAENELAELLAAAPGKEVGHE
ncbi:TPA: hypothetical protein NIA88_002478 [Pseudomonas aeruginosa]|nr:hypothetical protein [Pseudomonas aeruginosa]HCF1188333.1 hypothetical protein [Pseudomonas aeruginosa]